RSTPLAVRGAFLDRLDEDAAPPGALEQVADAERVAVVRPGLDEEAALPVADEVPQQRVLAGLRAGLRTRSSAHDAAGVLPAAGRFGLARAQPPAREDFRGTQPFRPERMRQLPARPNGKGRGLARHGASLGLPRAGRAHV